MATRKTETTVPLSEPFALVRIGDVTVPERFSVTVTWSGEVDFDMVAGVAVDGGVPRVTSVHLRAEGGLPLALLDEQWRWEWILEHAIASYAIGPSGLPTPIDTAQARTALRTVAKSTSKVDHYRTVARLYRAYPGRDVVQHVRSSLGTSYGTARRWISEARQLVDPDTGMPYLEAAPARGKRGAHE